MNNYVSAWLVYREKALEALAATRITSSPFKSGGRGSLVPSWNSLRQTPRYLIDVLPTTKVTIRALTDN